jgi:PAS domain S-box-containing protein
MTERSEGDQLLQELAELRHRVAELEASETRRKQAERALSVVYDALNSAAGGVVVANLDGRIRYVNPAFLRMFEYGDRAEVLGKTAADLFAAAEIQKFADVKTAMDETRGETEEFIARRKDGTVFPVEVSSSNVTDNRGNIVGRMASFVDITERKEMEKQLVRHERLAVLGQLTGGIAHELRHPVALIHGTTEMLVESLQDPDRTVEAALEILRKGVHRAERIINTLLGFARPSPPQRCRVHIGQVLQRTLSTIDVPDGVEIVVHVHKTLPAVVADPDQLDLVFGNLILNAIQAMPDGGRLVIKSWVTDLRSILISFADTGAGILEENLDKLFEPLFTTKAGGIGLGLAIVKMLVEAHHGHIEIQSQEGQGSTFTVRLPLE